MSDQGYVSPFTDDLDLIPNEALLLRRIPPCWIDWGAVDAAGIPRIISGAFQDYSAKKARDDFGLPGACMSVVVLEIVLREGKEPAELLEEYGLAHGLAELSGGALRRCDQGVQADPRPGEPWHAVVFAKTMSKRSNTMKSCLANSAAWHLPPTEQPIPALPSH